MLCFICYKNNLNRYPHSGYEDILNFLKVRKKQFYTTFLFKILNNKKDDSFLLSYITLKTNKELLYNNKTLPILNTL